MKLSMILLVAVLVAHPGLGARIPGINVKSKPSDDVETIVYQSVNSTNTNMMPDEAGPHDDFTSPPRKATFITECFFNGYPAISSLCWIDESTFLVLSRRDQSILKIDIDVRLGFCYENVLHRNITGDRMSCASDEEIYVSDGNNKVVTIMKGTSRVEWKPYKAPDTNWNGGIAVNDDLIALNFDNKSINIYSRERQFRFHVKSETDNYSGKSYLSISPNSSHLVESLPDTNYVYIHDMKRHTTIKVGGDGGGGGQLGYPAATSFDSSGRYILVSEATNGRISVFGVGGEFVHVLEVGPGGTDGQIIPNHAIIHREGKPSLLAVQRMGRYGRSVKIFSLST